jgi:hypothetical protein
MCECLDRIAILYEFSVKSKLLRQLCFSSVPHSQEKKSRHFGRIQKAVPVRLEVSPTLVMCSIWISQQPLTLGKSVKWRLCQYFSEVGDFETILEYCA